MKKYVSLILALVLSLTLAVPALAAGREEENAAAWELYSLGLFQGTGTDSQGFPKFALDKAPTRAEGVTMLVRLLGREDEAKAGTWTNDFRDVPAWAAPYVGYAYEKGLTTGRSATVFDPDTAVSASEYLTFVLRALGYRSGEDFAWDAAWILSDKLGFTHGDYNAQTDKDFDRGDVAVISAAALDAKEKNGGKTLREVLAGMGIDNKDARRCLWLEESVQCAPNQLVFAFNKGKDSPEVYTEFRVNSATVNGVPCQVEQHTTAEAVKQLCKDLTKAEGFSVTLPDAFALASLSYDEAAALAAATEFAENGGYPVLEIKLNCTGTLKDGTQVEELAVLPYYIPGYGGLYGEIF